MNSLKASICSKSTIIAQGLSYYIHLFAPEAEIRAILSISELMKADDLKSTVLFIDTAIISIDSHISLEKIKKKIGNGKLIGVYNQVLSDRVLPYFDLTLDFNAGNEEIRNLFGSIFIISDNNTNNLPDNHIISDRESEILKYVALGHTNKEIADQLRISAHTVITHRKNITAKLGIKTIAGLTVYAILNNIIKAEEIG